MHPRLIAVLAIGAIAGGCAATAHAQQSSTPGQNGDLGKSEYDAHCAVCHGSTGKGDGVFAGLLKSGTVVPNLTELSTKNNGVFPFKRVYETVDGTVLVKAHGTPDMPIWGREYKIQSYYVTPAGEAQEFVRAKILALTEYVYRLQAK